MEQQIPVNDITQDQPEKSSSTFDELPEPLREISQMATEAFREFQQSDTYEKILETKDKARDYIKENPVNSFFYALGAGTILGFILKRKK